jgi:hypothetical protein
MKRQLGTRFKVEVALAVIAAGLAVLTLIRRDWIEWTFGVEPDAGSGALEWALVVVFVIASVVSALLARAEWRGAAARSRE